MTDERFRARIIRLLSGEIRTDDLSFLFLYARDRCDGRESVQEIGDFVAHHDERYKGIVTVTTRDWVATAKWMAVAFGKKQGDLTLQNLPSFFPDYVEAFLRRCNPKDLRSRLRIDTKEAKKLWSQIRDKSMINNDGTVRISENLNNNEMGLIEYATSMLFIKPAFEEDRFFYDFQETLRSNNLLSKGEFKAFSNLKKPICLFAVSMMHNNAIKIKENEKIVLKADYKPSDPSVGVESDPSLVGVFASVPIPDGIVEESTNIISSMFSVKGNFEDLCSEELAFTNWNCEIELGTNGKLRKLG